MNHVAAGIFNAWRPPRVARDFPAPGPAGLPLARQPRTSFLSVHMALAVIPLIPIWVWQTMLQSGAAWHTSLGGFVLRLLACVLAVAIVETVYAVMRQRSIEPGWYLPAWLFTLTLPASAPVLHAATAIALGVLFGRLVFGGAGKHFVSPVLLAWVLLQAGYPAAPGELPFGTATTIACAGAALYLVITRTVSWRILLGGILGVWLSAHMVTFAGADFAMPWQVHLLTGALAFGLVFLAGEPACAPLTPGGRWFLGLAAGALTVLIRSFDPTHPDGAMHAILLAALFAPLADWLVVHRAMSRRKRRERDW